MDTYVPWSFLNKSGEVEANLRQYLIVKEDTNKLQHGVCLFEQIAIVYSIIYYLMCCPTPSFTP